MDDFEDAKDKVTLEHKINQKLFQIVEEAQLTTFSTCWQSL